MTLEKELGGNQVTAIVIPNDSCTEGILEVSKQANDSYDRICYVSLNKLFKELEDVAHIK